MSSALHWPQQAAGHTATAPPPGKGSTLKQLGKGGLGGRRGFASASVALSESVMSAPQAPVSTKVRVQLEVRRLIHDQHHTCICSRLNCVVPVQGVHEHVSNEL